MKIPIIIVVPKERRSTAGHQALRGCSFSIFILKGFVQPAQSRRFLCIQKGSMCAEARGPKKLVMSFSSGSHLPVCGFRFAFFRRAILVLVEFLVASTTRPFKHICRLIVLPTTSATTSLRPTAADSVLIRSPCCLWPQQNRRRLQDTTT